MIGKDDLNNEEPIELKVTDKRKFNLDGSIREGVVLEEDKPKAEPAAESPIISISEAAAESAQSDSVIAAESSEALENDLSEDDFADADDPASFLNFLSTLASQAAAALGALPNPVTGQRSVDLETGKYWIEVLVMLRDKTKGNLQQREQQLFNGLLGDLQMQFVALNRASEEKLKNQAAQKFSASDILGKK